MSIHEIRTLTSIGEGQLPGAGNAVMKCPSCGSHDTKVMMYESKTRRAGVSIDADVRWECAVCHSVFKPSEQHEANPVLMCGKCSEPRRHTYVRDAERKWREPTGTESKTSVPIYLEIYACYECGTEREYGFAHR